MKYIIAADFETTSDIYNPEVYSFGMKSDKLNNGKLIYGISINDFFKEIEKFKRDYIMYFHNLKGFDGHFIIPALEENGYRQQKFRDSKKTLKVISTSPYKEDNKTEEKQFFLKEKEYTILADKNKKIIEIKIGLPATKTRKGKTVNRILSIRDSLLLFTGSIAGFGEALNKKYNTDKYTKLDISSNYDKKEKYKTIKELEEDGNELEYLERDIDILYSYLKENTQVLPFNKWKLTAASTSYSEWKETFGEKVLNMNIENGLLEKIKPTNSKEDDGFYKIRYKGKQKQYSTTTIKNKLIKHYLPTGWMNQPTENGTIMSQEVYKWFSGGMTHVHPDKKGIIFGNKQLIKVDVNSSYPSVMRFKDLPIGAAYHGDGGEEYKIKFLRIISKTKITNPKGLPFLPIGNGTSWEYRRDIPKGRVFHVTNFVFERVQKYYKGKWDVEIVMSFKSINGEKIFGDFIDKWNAIKEQGKQYNDPIQKQQGKDRNNTIFGKFATRTDLISSIWNPEAKEWEQEETITKTDFYLPIAVCITAYARMYLVDAVGEYYKYFVYEDTDSIVWIKKHIDKLNVKYHPSKLGYFDIEEDNANGVFRRPKQYMIITYDKDNNKKTNIKYAGMNIKDKNSVEYEDFITGFFVEEQKRPLKTPTGIVILNIQKEIKPIWEYKATYDDWFTNETNFYERYDTQLQKVKEQIK